MQLTVIPSTARYLQIRKALLRGKGKAPLVDDDEKDVEDIGGVGGTPSSSTANLESDDSFDDVVPLGQASVRHFVSGDFARPNRNLDILVFDLLNISERPSLVPAGPCGSSAKRRRVAIADARSPLGRSSADDDWLYCLEEPKFTVTQEEDSRTQYHYYLLRVPLHL